MSSCYEDMRAKNDAHASHDRDGAERQRLAMGSIKNQTPPMVPIRFGLQLDSGVSCRRKAKTVTL